MVYVMEKRNDKETLFGPVEANTEANLGNSSKKDEDLKPMQMPDDLWVMHVIMLF